MDRQKLISDAQARMNLIERGLEPKPPFLYAAVAAIGSCALLSLVVGEELSFVQVISGMVVSAAVGFWYGMDKQARFENMVRSEMDRLKRQLEE